MVCDGNTSVAVHIPFIHLPLEHWLSFVQGTQMLLRQMPVMQSELNEHASLRKANMNPGRADDGMSDEGAAGDVQTKHGSFLRVEQILFSSAQTEFPPSMHS